MMRRRYFVWAAILTLFLDQVSKIMIYGMVRPGEQARVLGDVLKVLHQENARGVFGWSLGPQWVYFLLPLVGIVLVLWFALRTDNAWSAVAYGMILGGAFGNLVDRVRLGQVIDFIDVGWRGWRWFTFNVADSAVVVGIIMLIGREFLWHRKPAAETAQSGATHAPGVPDGGDSGEKSISR